MPAHSLLEGDGGYHEAPHPATFLNLAARKLVHYVLLRTRGVGAVPETSRLIP